MIDKTVAVLIKDVRSEFRTRYAISAIIMFAIVTVVAVGFAIGGTGLEKDLQGVFLWLVIYFASLAGLGQSFIKEEENKTADALRIYAPPSAVFTGKYMFNLLLLICLEIIVIPLYISLIGLQVKCISLFMVVLVLGTLGLSGATTIIAAIISKASVKGILFAVLSFPLVLPILVMAIRGTQKSIYSNAVFVDGIPELKVLLSFTIVMTIAGFMLFEYVWNG